MKARQRNRADSGESQVSLALRVRSRLSGGAHGLDARAGLLEDARAVGAHEVVFLECIRLIFGKTMHEVCLDDFL